MVNRCYIDVILNGSTDGRVNVVSSTVDETRVEDETRVNGK